MKQTTFAAEESAAPRADGLRRMKEGHMEVIIRQERLTAEEYDGVLSYMELLGLEDGFVQELDSAQEAYIPQWEL